MTITLNPHTTVSGVNELLSLREQIDALTARLAEVASHITDNAEFMDGRVFHLHDYDAKRAGESPLGTVFHLASFCSEKNPGSSHYGAHPADNCPIRRRVFWCGRRIGEKVRTAYTRAPGRSWHTYMGTWVLVAFDDTRDSETATFVAIEEVRR